MDVTDEQLRTYCVDPAAELRQQIWSQIYMLDAEYRQYSEAIECALT